MNCSHCFIQSFWKKQQNATLIFNINITSPATFWTKIQDSEVFRDGEMPYLGVTVVDDEGLQIIEAYLESCRSQSLHRSSLC